MVTSLPWAKPYAVDNVHWAINGHTPMYAIAPSSHICQQPPIPLAFCCLMAPPRHLLREPPAASPRQGAQQQEHQAQVLRLAKTRRALVCTVAWLKGSWRRDARDTHGLNHLVVQIVALARALTHASEHGETTCDRCRWVRLARPETTRSE